MDAGGRVYLAWQDCRFIRQCRANDIVLTTTTDGVTWTPVRRIPLDAKKSGVDHFIPGIAADPQTSGGAAHLALTYYYYDHAACTAPTCTLNVGFATSRDGGATWSTQTKLAGPMELAWLPDTSLGAMVGDYISTSFVGGKAVPVLAMARSFTTRFREAIYAPTNGLPVPVGVNPVSVEPVEATQSDHAARPVRRVP
jgi:hypothetical protein